MRAASLCLALSACCRCRWPALPGPPRDHRQTSRPAPAAPRPTAARRHAIRRQGSVQGGSCSIASSRVVNDGVVLRERARCADARDHGAPAAQNVALPPDDVLRSQVLDQLVLEEIESQRADRAGIKVSDEQVNAALEEIAKRQNTTLRETAGDAGGRGRHRLCRIPRAAAARDRPRDPAASGTSSQRIAITPRELDQYIEQAAEDAPRQPTNTTSRTS